MSAIQLFYDGDALTYDGEGLYYIPGNIEIPLPAISGGMAAEGDVGIPLIQVLGFFATDGVMSIPILSIYGKTQDVINGEIVIRGLQFDGYIGVSARIDSDITLPLLTLAGDMQVDGEINLHLLSIGGFLQQQGVGVGEIALPLLGVSGEMNVTTWFAGALVIPSIIVTGELEAVAATLSGGLSIPIMAVAGVVTLATENDFGTETDRVLRYASSRRSI